MTTETYCCGWDSSLPAEGGADAQNDYLIQIINHF